MLMRKQSFYEPNLVNMKEVEDQTQCPTLTSRLQWNEKAALNGEVSNGLVLMYMAARCD